MVRKYSPTEAVNYALTHGTSPNPDYKYFGVHGVIGGDCTNFISQCLKAGGAEMIYGSELPWWYRGVETINLTSHTWSISWSIANSLYWLIKERGKKNLRGLKGVEVSDITMLGLGDLIFYENFQGVINHSTIITGFYDGLPLITQHTYDATNISYIKKNKGKMHFMKLTF